MTKTKAKSKYTLIRITELLENQARLPGEKDGIKSIWNMIQQCKQIQDQEYRRPEYKYNSKRTIWQYLQKLQTEIDKVEEHAKKLKTETDKWQIDPDDPE